MLAYLIQGIILGFPAAAQPGPFQAYLLSQTLKNGWRRTLPAALAPLLSDGPIIIIVILILTQLPDNFLRLIQIAGSLFLFYLAWQAFKTFRNHDFIAPQNTPSSQNIFEAALTNFLNPNPWIFWVGVGGVNLLEAWQALPLYGFVFLLGFYFILIGGFAGFIILFGITEQVDPRFSRALTGLSAVALALFGIFQLLTAFDLI